MPEIGKPAQLRVVRESPNGVYLDGETLGEILLPRRYCDKTTLPESTVEVFVHRDSEDRLVATTEMPYLIAGEIGSLRVKSVHPNLGAFLDWGLSRDLLLPRREQSRPLSVGDFVIVHVFLDRNSQHLVASARLDDFLSTEPPTYAENESVRLLVAEETPLGYRTVVNGLHWGMLFKSDLGAPIDVGREFAGYVRRIRADGKIDLMLDQAGYKRVTPLALRILEQLKAAGGRLDYNDASSPDAIRGAFGVSKKAFKQAIGALYRAQRIQLVEGGIEIVASQDRGT